MSYILDALRKSETERRQGKVPDLGQQVQLIHRPKKRRISPVVWVALALLVNAGVLAVVFWPERTSHLPVEPEAPIAKAEPALEQPLKPESTEPKISGGAPVRPIPEDLPEAQTAVVSPPEPEPEMEQVAEPVRERPTIITPAIRSERQVPASSQDDSRAGIRERVPHLVELPLSFQKSIPDLMFNSHIYSSDPYASRVMINGNYLRQGESFSGITVEKVTEDGVVLSKQGRSFRVGIVRDWVSPR
ncbi:general secretion pathway protein GspB [Marinobacter sp. 2_MG-2023]|uniref:general secretion pathway protein GspB n=1 Tax=Marinobacter sp. 2_MG-2023 TaxID=3062679 RepID=UPI0026E40563|nr:general secretion pathway protein GspB [Marinobacter sp. 2_MG-2023]MDO6442477.1 general secretion pathway protein GspB [Marinobacter sp. 2_MG-2023]